MGAGARFGFGRLYWGASAIVVLGLALELAVLAAISAVNEGRLTRGPRMVMRLAYWAPFVWLGVNLVYVATYRLLAALTGDDIRRRLGAMALAPLGAGLVAALAEVFSRWQDGVFFLIGGAIFGYVTLGMPMLAAGIWVAAQRPKQDVQGAELGTGSQ